MRPYALGDICDMTEEVKIHNTHYCTNINLTELSGDGNCYKATIQISVYTGNLSRF